MQHRPQKQSNQREKRDYTFYFDMTDMLTKNSRELLQVEKAELERAKKRQRT